MYAGSAEWHEFQGVECTGHDSDVPVEPGPCRALRRLGSNFHPRFSRLHSGPSRFGVEHRELVGGLLRLQFIDTWVPAEDS